jgi:hypothetical protein
MKILADRVRNAFVGEERGQEILFRPVFRSRFRHFNRFASNWGSRSSRGIVTVNGIRRIRRQTASPI